MDRLEIARRCIEELNQIGLEIESFSIDASTCAELQYECLNWVLKNDVIVPLKPSSDLRLMGIPVKVHA